MQSKPVALAALSALLLVGLTFCVKPLTAQFASPRQQTSSAASWTTEKWTGDDKPYAAAREHIDQEFSRGGITVSYLKALETTYNQDERDPLTLFRWAYARYRAQGLHPAIPFTTMPAEGAFNEVPSPHTYEYARVRFLIKTSLSRPRELMAIGKRLLDQNSSDFDVAFALSRCFGETLSVEEKQSALRYSDHLINRYPDKPSVYAVKADIYFGYWIDHRNKQDARDAIKWYQQYLRLAPMNYEWRKHAQKTIALLQSRL